MKCERCGEVNPAEIHTCTPKQEPVAWHEPGAYGNVTVYKKWADENGWVPLYTAPPQREWQGLTNEEVFAALVAVDGNTQRLAPGFIAFYRAIEAKLKEKNYDS